MMQGPRSAPCHHCFGKALFRSDVPLPRGAWPLGTRVGVSAGAGSERCCAAGRDAVLAGTLCWPGRCAGRDAVLAGANGQRDLAAPLLVENNSAWRLLGKEGCNSR